mgnify:CR=1 FL=1
MTYLTETFIPYTKVLTPLLLEGLWITIYVSALAFCLVLYWELYWQLSSIFALKY